MTTCISRALAGALTGVLLALAAAGAAAQNIKPGLWEITSRMGGNAEMDKAMAQVQQQMAAMPPEQRKMMQDMLAKQGMSVAPGAGGAMVSKVCLTKDMVQRNQLPVQDKGNCASTVSNASAAGMDMRFTCTDPAASGQGRVNFRGDSAYDMKMTMNTTHQGKPMTSTLDATGKWLGADCGAIKPMALPGK